MANNWPSFTPSQLINVQLTNKQSWHDNYYVMFSTIWGGYCTDPALWGIPPDDHMAHRGDAVFETFKCVNGKAYGFNEHLERLSVSAKALSITVPLSNEKIFEVLRGAYRLGGHQDFTVRLTVSRGPGSFSVNPYEAIGGSQLYLITTKLKRPSPEVYDQGVKLATDPFPAKSEYAGIKSCDYLHNVFAKKNAIDRGADYVVSFDKDGFMTEGATENVAVITKTSQLIVPQFSRILKGVTLVRVMELAQKLVDQGLLKSVGHGDLTEQEAKNQAAEIFLTTTSFDVLGVSQWDGEPVGLGRTGPITKELFKLIDDDIHDITSPYLTPLG
jgi:branched-chain amino acid aminotransferase